MPNQPHSGKGSGGTAAREPSEFDVTEHRGLGHLTREEPYKNNFGDAVG